MILGHRSTDTLYISQISRRHLSSLHLPSASSLCRPIIRQLQLHLHLRNNQNQNLLPGYTTACRRFGSHSQTRPSTIGFLFYIFFFLMHLESKAYDSPRDHSRPSTPASQGQGHSHSQPQHGPPTPAPPPARNISSASSSSGFVRRPRSAIVPPVTASFAPAQAQAQAQAQDLPVSPTSSSTSSLFSSVFSSAPYHTADRKSVV